MFEREKNLFFSHPKNNPDHIDNFIESITTDAIDMIKLVQSELSS